jgi:hypothetical protein
MTAHMVLRMPTSVGVYRDLILAMT